MGAGAFSFVPSRALLYASPFLMPAAPHGRGDSSNFAALPVGLFLPTHPPSSGTPGPAGPPLPGPGTFSRSLCCRPRSSRKAPLTVPASPPEGGMPRSGRGKHSDRIRWMKQGAVVGCVAEPLPAAETGEAEQGQPSKYASGRRPALHIWSTATRSSAPIFTRALRRPPGKLAKRKRTAAQRQGGLR